MFNKPNYTDHSATCRQTSTVSSRDTV